MKLILKTGLLILVVAMLGACGSEDDDDHSTQDTVVQDTVGDDTSAIDSRCDDDAMADEDLAVEDTVDEVDGYTGASKPESELDSDHDGWKKAACWNCHDEDDHNSGLDPYLCADCHGTNGAPEGHKDSGSCNGCHGEPHGSTGFPDPLSCATCHPK